MTNHDPHNTAALLRDYLPAHCHQVLYVGGGASALADALPEDSAIAVHAIAWDAETDRAAFAPPSLASSPDLAIVDPLPNDETDPAPMIQFVAAVLAPQGAVFLVNASTNTSPWEAFGLVPYRDWALPGLHLAMLVREHYDPIAHARALTKHGDFAGAMGVLDLVPDALCPDDASRARLRFERQLCVTSMPVGANPDLLLYQIQEGQTWFYESIRFAPDFLPPYILQSELWRRLGDGDMARSLVASIHHAHPTTESTDRLARLSPYAPPQPTPPTPPTPPATPTTPTPSPLRILFFTHTRPDYGLDTLYDGLCAVLGDDAVTEFPYKPSLHDPVRATDTRYPCVFDRQGTPMDAADVVAALNNGAFDAILFGLMDQEIPPATVQAILNAAGDLPCFVLDQQDNPRNNLPNALAYARMPRATAYFKREMLRTSVYPERTIPLPFSYAQKAPNKNSPSQRPTPLFWAGHRQLGLRRLYLEHIERRFSLDLDQHLSQEAYQSAMTDALAGISIFGGGYDTVRYWELPAHGVLLIGERLPIHIPHDFTDGENALLFRDLPELEERVDFVLHHAEEARAIADRGFAHFAQFHTHEARARQLLAHIAAFLTRL